MDHEWISWREARKRLDAAGLCPSHEPPVQLADWAGAALLDIKASPLLSDDRPVEDGLVPPKAWKFATNGINGWVKWDRGEFQCKLNCAGMRPSPLLKGYNLMVRRTQLDRLAPIAIGSGDQVERQARPRKMTAAPIGPPISKFWPSFVAELVLWVEEANDSPAGMTAGGLIKKLNDRLAAKGLDEMPRSTAEPTIKAVLEALQQDG